MTDTDQIQYRVRIVGTFGPMSPYGIHDTREEAERLLEHVSHMQARSPFPTGGAWVEREVDGGWVRVDAR